MYCLVAGWLHEELFQLAGKLLYRRLILRVADVEYLPIADAILIFDDLHQAGDAVVDVGEAAFLHAAVNQFYGVTAEEA